MRAVLPILLDYKLIQSYLIPRYPLKLCVLTCSRSVGYRFGPHLAETVPLLISYCTSASENDEELREYSLQV